MQGPTTSKNGPSESQVLAPAASPQEITLSETPDEVNSIHESVSTVSSPRDIAIKDNDPEPHRQKVTIWLIALLAGLIFVHYVAMFVLDWKGKKIENVSNAFNATLRSEERRVGKECRSRWSP